MAKEWDHRFGFESKTLGSTSLPVIRPKPYISKNGSEVKSVLQLNHHVNYMKNKKKKKKNDGGAKRSTRTQQDIRPKNSNCTRSGPKVETLSLTPHSKLEKTRYASDSLMGKISKAQQGKIRDLRGKARPLSLPLIRQAQSPLPIGVEKSFSARDSSTRTPILKIDVSMGEVSTIEKNHAQEFHEITEDCEPAEMIQLFKLFCVGKGSSAYVYKSVLFPRFHVVADKVVVVANRDKSKQLIRELKSLRALLKEDETHPFSKNIVRLIEVYPNPRDGTISICLEYMEGGSLQDVVRNGGCQDELVLIGLIRQIISGVSYLHSHRLIHRDIKPGNILLGVPTRCDSHALVKLSDFGISKELEKGHSLADSFLGTFHYMSPERIAGKDYSFSSDIWGCGLSLLAVAMGCYPFSKKIQHKRVNHGEGKVRKDGIAANQNKNKFDQGSYWHILQSISHRPSIKQLLGNNHVFSSHFCNFLSASMHRDRDLRATADFLLAHPLLSKSSQSPKEIADSGFQCLEGEMNALRCFIRQCHQDHKLKLTSSLNSQSLPTMIHSMPLKSCDGDAEFILTNLNLTVVAKKSGEDETSAAADKLFYDKDNADDVGYFFNLLRNYWDFVIRELSKNKKNSMEHNVDLEPNFQDISPLLQNLLDSSLSLAGSSGLAAATNVEALPPCLSALFDPYLYQRLSNELSVPKNIVVLSFRDLVLGLLNCNADNFCTEANSIENRSSKLDVVSQFTLQSGGEVTLAKLSVQDADADLPTSRVLKKEASHQKSIAEKISVLRDDKSSKDGALDGEYEDDFEADES